MLNEDAGDMFKGMIAVRHKRGVTYCAPPIFVQPEVRNERRPTRSITRHYASSSRCRRCVISRRTGCEWRAINRNGRDPCAWVIPKGER